jgi:hypothetical protein
MGEKMDRGTDALKTNVSSISKMDVRQVSAYVSEESIQAREEAPYTSGEGVRVRDVLEDTSYPS